MKSDVELLAPSVGGVLPMEEQVKLLLCDLDGTIVDVHARAVERGHFTNHPPCTWDFRCCTTTDINEIFEDDDVFGNAEPIPGAIAGVKRLMETFDVRFVSTPWHTNHNSARLKYEWIERHFGDPKLLTLTHDKTLIPADALIDDKPNLVGPWRHIEYPQPWNRCVWPTWETGLARSIEMTWGLR